MAMSSKTWLKSIGDVILTDLVSILKTECRKIYQKILVNRKHLTLYLIATNWVVHCSLLGVLKLLILLALLTLLTDNTVKASQETEE